jgi:hypothetical protein
VVRLGSGFTRVVLLSFSLVVRLGAAGLDVSEVVGIELLLVVLLLAAVVLLALALVVGFGRAAVVLLAFALVVGFGGASLEIS